MKKKYGLSKVIFCFMMVCTLLVGMSLSVVAATTSEADATLRENVHDEIEENEYQLEGGGYITGSDLMPNEGDGAGYNLNESQFQSLTSKAQTQVVEDIARASNNSVVRGQKENTGVTEQTVQNWWKELQQSNGVGSKFLNTILQNTKPDFVSANAIWKPFAGPVGIVLGLIAVMLMSFLGIVIVSDIAYITLPPIRIFVSDDEKGQKLAKSKLFSFDAIYAVQQAESESDGGSPKHALGIYLRRRIIMLILLGICLLYLVQGQLYTLVGWILDLVSGFLGF